MRCSRKSSPISFVTPDSHALIFLLLLLLWPVFAWNKAFASESVIYLPPGNLYPPSLADPHRVGFGVQQLYFTSPRIPDSGNSRVAIRAGGRFGVVRSGTPDEGSTAWQMDILGGFNAQFDDEHAQDNIGWDGRYGLVLTASRPGDVAFKFGMLHDSSHVGDEYAERSGRLRINYTREELVAGVSCAAGGKWRTYAEGGYGYVFGNDELMKPGRAQAGLEYDACKGGRQRCTGWYGALDLSATEERNWRLDTALQTGVAVRTNGRAWRIGVEWYRGRPPIGEFFQYTETYVSLGLWLDV